MLNFFKKVIKQKSITLGHLTIGRVHSRIQSFDEGFYPSFQEVEKWSLSFATFTQAYGIFWYFTKKEWKTIEDIIWKEDDDSEEDMARCSESLRKIKERRNYKGA